MPEHNQRFATVEHHRADTTLSSYSFPADSPPPIDSPPRWHISQRRRSPPPPGTAYLYQAYSVDAPRPPATGKGVQLLPACAYIIQALHTNECAPEEAPTCKLQRADGQVHQRSLRKINRTSGRGGAPQTANSTRLCVVFPHSWRRLA